MDTRPPLWMTRVITPHGPAKDEETVRIALLLGDLKNLEVRPRDPDNGYWLIGFPTDLTENWTVEKTGGGVVLPVLDLDERLWLIDVPIPH